MNKIQQYLNAIADPVTKSTLRLLLQKFSFGGNMRNKSFAEGETIPTAGLVGYAPGCVFHLSDAALGQCPTWVNFGTALSCAFYPVGEVMGYGIAYGATSGATVGGDAVETVSNPAIRLGDITITEHSTSNDNDVICAQKPSANGVLTVTSSTDPSTAHAYQYVGLRDKCLPGWDIFAAGIRAAVTGDTTAIPITVTGAATGDIAFANVVVTDDTDEINNIVVTANTVTLTSDNDPGTTHSWSYCVLKPRGGFKPSHYIAYAGEYAAVAGDTTTVAISIPGVLATDVPIVQWATTNDTDKLTKVVVTADTLTLTVDNDPVTDHSWAYMILRAY